MKLLVLGAIILGGTCSPAVTTKTLECEYLTDPIGIDTASPRLSWIIFSGERGEKQTAYEVLVSSSAKLLDSDTGDIWNSGKVVSDETSQITYQGSPLESRQVCFWKVRVWDRDGKPSGWSPPAQWQMGLLQPTDWKAKWIAPAISAALETNLPLIIKRAIYGADMQNCETDVTKSLVSHIDNNLLNLTINNGTFGVDPAHNVVKRLWVDYDYSGQAYNTEVLENQILTLPEQWTPVPYLRKTFKLKSPLQRAVLYVTALGLYEVHINGQRVGDHLLAPDWTDYRKRVRYQAYDVTKLLKAGNNAMAALLASGWFSGHIGNGGFEFFGKKPAFLAQLEVTYKNGQTEQIATDSSWKSHDSPILSSDLMMGEEYDSRQEIRGWDQPWLADGQWFPVIVRVEPFREMDSQVMEPVRELQELKPKSVSEPRPGCWVYDLGQNMVGFVRLKVTAPTGTTVTLRHAEMLNPNGTLYTQNLRSAISIDHYICKGNRVETWQPRFTFHGFRHVEITGLPGRPKIDAVTGIVIGSDNPKTGTFACSDPRINQLQSNIQWSQRGNYISIPTDCPQRDERLGWMGDAQVFVRTATCNADVAAFFTKWLVDVDDGQSPMGAFSDVSPNTSDHGGVAAWGDAGVICPWTIYEIYGDKRILECHLPAMIKWVQYLRKNSNGLIRDKDYKDDYGDWLSYRANTPKDLIATAFFAYSTQLLAKSCKALGQVEEANKYEQLFENIKTAFNQRYVTANGHIYGNTQCAYCLALKFELLPEELRQKAAEYLVEDIQNRGEHLSTGFIGVSYLLPVLTQTGHADTAYQLLLQDTFPSWLFSVKHGATTIWERWNGWTPEKGFQNPAMNSFNHYSLGSCGEYLFGGIGGIRPASPGFKTILIEPIIGDGLIWAKTSYDSIHGTIDTAWKRTGHQFELKVVVPTNTSACVYLPASSLYSITESGKSLLNSKGVKLVRFDGDCAVIAIESGTYRFASQIADPAGSKSAFLAHLPPRA